MGDIDDRRLLVDGAAYLTRKLVEDPACGALATGVFLGAMLRGLHMKRPVDEGVMAVLEALGLAREGKTTALGVEGSLTDQGRVALGTLSCIAGASGMRVA